MLPAHVVRENSAGEYFTAVGVGASRKSVRQRKLLLVNVVNMLNSNFFAMISLIKE